jgi:hypothetical protein
MIQRRDVQKVVPIVSVGVSVFGHPTGTCQQGMEAFHIQKRDGAMNGAKEIRTHRVHVAHQETACNRKEKKKVKRVRHDPKAKKGNRTTNNRITFDSCTSRSIK